MQVYNFSIELGIEFPREPSTLTAAKNFHIVIFECSVTFSLVQSVDVFNATEFLIVCIYVNG